jgi:hypothetical protein
MVPACGHSVETNDRMDSNIVFASEQLITEGIKIAIDLMLAIANLAPYRLQLASFAYGFP